MPGFMPYIRVERGRAAWLAPSRRPARSEYQAPAIRSLPTSLPAPYAARPRANVRAAHIPRKSFTSREIILDVGAAIAIIKLWIE